MSRLSLLELHSGGGSDRQPDVVLSRQMPLVLMWPNTISNREGSTRQRQTGGGPCSTHTPNVLVCNKLNYGVGKMSARPGLI